MAISLGISVGQPSGSFAQDTGAIERCHQLAGDPDDPMKIAAAAGVPDGAISEEAIAVCRVAVAQSPSDPVLNYQFGRALLEFGNVDDALEPLTVAAEANEPAALYLYALVMREQGSGTEEDLSFLLNSSLQGGYTPASIVMNELGIAVESAEEREEQAADSSGLDYTMFERPDIMKAMVEGDQDFLRGVKIGIVGEQLTGAIGFVKYYDGFSTALAGPFFCPALLPAGASAVLSSRVARQAINTPPEETLGILLGHFGSYAGSQTPMTEFVDRSIQGETSAQLLGEQGTKDAYILFSLGNTDANWGCSGPASLEITKTVRALMN